MSDPGDVADLLTRAAEAARRGDHNAAELHRQFRDALETHWPKRSDAVSDPNNWTGKVDRIFLVLGLAVVAFVVGLIILAIRCARG